MIDTRFWHDGWVRKLNALDRYLFLYLITNDKCSFCGIYELPISTIAHECGIDEHDLEKSMLPRLEPKVFYREGWVYLPNFKKHHVSEKSKNSSVGYTNALMEVPDNILAIFEGIGKPLQAPSSPSDTIAIASAITILGDSKESQIKTTKKMKKNSFKYNESKHQDFEDVIDIDSGEMEEDPEEKTTQAITEIIEWAERVRQKQFFDKPTQRSFIRKMKDMGLSPVDIKKTYNDLLHSEYWKTQDRLPDFKTVYSNLKNKK